MTHEEARELMGGDPQTVSAELREHLQGCDECRTYREEMLAFEAKLRRALELPWEQAPAPRINPAVTAGTIPSDKVIPLKRPEPSVIPKLARPRLFGLAASLVAALVVGVTVWLSRPQTSLASEIVTHVEGEPNSWNANQPVDSSQLDAVLRKSGVRLGPGMLPVVYASSCFFRGHFVPHVVVTTPHGPVTVMILLNESVTAPQQFNSDGYRGLLVPAPTGSVAVLSRTPMQLEQPAADVVHALQTAR